MGELHEGWFHAGELMPILSSTPVEYLGGPNDGEFRPFHENGVRPNGMYIPVNGVRHHAYYVVAMRYLPAQSEN